MAPGKTMKWTAENELNLLLVALAQNSTITLDTNAAVQAWPPGDTQPTERALRDRFNLLKNRAATITGTAIPKSSSKKRARTSAPTIAATTATTTATKATPRAAPTTPDPPAKGPNLITETSGGNSYQFNKRLGIQSNQTPLHYRVEPSRHKKRNRRNIDNDDIDDDDDDTDDEEKEYEYDSQDSNETHYEEFPDQEPTPTTTKQKRAEQARLAKN